MFFFYHLIDDVVQRGCTPLRERLQTSRTRVRVALETTPNLTVGRKSQSSSKPRKPSAPSGIAQLRQSLDHGTNDTMSDPMNLDDFIFPSSVGSPAGISTSDTSEHPALTNNNAMATAIPIKMRKEQQQQQQQPMHPPMASAPVPPQDMRHRQEFGYVPKHVRKTSIDDSRVCTLVANYLAWCKCMLTLHCFSLENDLPSPHLRFLPPQAS